MDASLMVTNYWLCFYQKGGFCTLCGNTGVIDTRSMPWGRMNWCVCPNGQSLRTVNGAIGPNYNRRPMVEGDL